MQSSSIFLEKATIIDVAILDDVGLIHGFSWYVDVLWHGTLLDDGVLLDFSDAKKLVKEVIDLHFDHRLFASKKYFNKNNELNNNFFIMHAPNYFFYKMEDNLINDILSRNFILLQNIIAEEVKKITPKNIFNIEVKLHTSKEKYIFNYTHCLVYHSGNCQRVHGHSGVLKIYKNKIFCEKSTMSCINLLNNKFFIQKKHTQIENDFIIINYTGNQGDCFIKILKSNVQLLDVESTIEQLSIYIKNNLCKFITNIDYNNKYDIIIYEGLQKGVSLNLL